MSDPLPRLRLVEAHPIDHDGNRMFLLKDPAGYGTEGITISPELLFVIQHFDGQTTFDQASENFKKQFGQELMHDDISQIIGFLDQHHLLETESFLEFQKKTDDEFIRAADRPFVCHHPEQNPDDIRGFIDEFFGKFPPKEPIRKNLRGIIAPHIDYQRGQKVYPSAYAPLFEQFKGRTLIIFGTNHQTPRPFVGLTEKNYTTPFGTLLTDREFIKDIAGEINGDPFSNPLAHRSEHSVELAATMAAYGGMDVKVVPVLISGFHEFIVKGEKPGDDPMISSAIGTIKSRIEKEPDRFSIIASVDFAHVGKQFGDNIDLDDSFLANVEAKDRESIDLICKGDAEGFFDYLAGENDERHVCGLGPIYLALSVLAPVTGTLLAYDKWIHPDKFGSVSFAAMGLV